MVPTVNTLMENAYMVMTFRSSSNKIVQSEIILLYPDPENSQKGAILHRCGACHRASDAKVRMSNSRKAVLGRCQCVCVFVCFSYPFSFRGSRLYIPAGVLPFCPLEH